MLRLCGIQRARIHRGRGKQAMEIKYPTPIIVPNSNEDTVFIYVLQLLQYNVKFLFLLKKKFLQCATNVNNSYAHKLNDI